MVSSNLYGLLHVAPLTATAFTSVAAAAVTLEIVTLSIGCELQSFPPHPYPHSLPRMQPQRLSDVQKGAIAAFHILEHKLSSSQIQGGVPSTDGLIVELHVRFLGSANYERRSS